VIGSTIIDYTNFLSQQADFLFDGLNTDYKRKQYYHENFDVIKPEKVILETKLTANPDNESDTDFGQVSTFWYFIPFKPSLEKLHNIIPETENLKYSSSSSSLKSDIFDGKYIKNKLEKKSNKNQLVFLIYCDDVELVNPIGAQRTKHKISS
jgi:hypothetical protein